MGDEDETRKANKDNSVDNNSSSSSDNQEEAGGIQMDSLMKFFLQKCNLSSESTNSEDEAQILSEPTLDGIVEFIKNNNVTKIITMAGAGISTSAGIPDFRSPKSGIYHNLAKYNLPHAEAIFSIDYFKENPEPFFRLAKELLPEGYKPTISHYFIRLLHEKGLLLRHYTQNIDSLERIAGIPEEKLIEAHGTFETSHCLKCGSLYELSWMKEKIKEATVPKCEDCGEGVVKPDIIFFGEKLPDRFDLQDQDFPQAELLIIMGSSLTVFPFASLVEMVKSDCPRLLINKENVKRSRRVPDVAMSLFGLKNNRFGDSDKRDVAWLGECDKGCTLLAEKLGWADDLKNLIAKERELLDKKATDSKGQRHSESEKASTS